MLESRISWINSTLCFAAANFHSPPGRRSSITRPLSHTRRPPWRRCSIASARSFTCSSTPRITPFKGNFMDQKSFAKYTRRDFIRQAACAAVGTSAITSAIRDLRFMNAAVAQSNISDYKALVCIFLSGGNDSNNLIIPTIQSEWDNYATIRGVNLAIPLSGAPFNVLPIAPLNSDGHGYG